MTTFDTFDAKILKLLQRDAALPLDEIAATVGLSRNAVWRRVKALEASGVIRSRVALLDPEQLGRGLTVFMLIRTDRHAPDWQERFAKATRLPNCHPWEQRVLRSSRVERYQSHLRCG